MNHPSSSHVQTELEAVLLERACQKLDIGTPVTRAMRIEIGGGQTVVVDGWVEHPEAPLALELFTTLGKPKPGQTKKFCTDLLKLILITKLRPGARGVVVLPDQVTADFLAAGWRSQVLASFPITLCVVALTEQERAHLEAARLAQRTGNRALDGE